MSMLAAAAAGPAAGRPQPPAGRAHSPCSNYRLSSSMMNLIISDCGPPPQVRQLDDRSHQLAELKRAKRARRSNLLAPDR